MSKALNAVAPFFKTPDVNIPAPRPTPEFVSEDTGAAVDRARRGERDKKRRRFGISQTRDIDLNQPSTQIASPQARLIPFS